MNSNKELCVILKNVYQYIKSVSYGVYIIHLVRPKKVIAPPGTCVKYKTRSNPEAKNSRDATDHCAKVIFEVNMSIKRREVSLFESISNGNDEALIA